MKNEATIIHSDLPEGSAIWMIDHLVREGARQMLQSAIESEVSEYIERHQHIRTTNVIESAFATVRHRQRQTKGNGSRKAALAMIYKLGARTDRDAYRRRMA